MNAAVRDLQILFEVGSLGGLSDGQLLGRFLERRERAVFEAIINRHGPMVWGVCRRVLRDHHDAEDAFQATFLVLARKAASVMPRERLGNWLYGVAYQTAMNARAMRAKRRVRESQVSEMPEPMAVPDDWRDERAESLDQELSRLPEKYRMPIVLCELEGMSHKEAASQLGCPIGTVSSRLSRARAMLAERLSRRGLSLSAGTLAVLLAQESASAGMPTQLIGTTARAASLYAAGGAVTAEAVSAGVAALTREVMKMKLLGKFKVGVGMLLVASAVAGWIGLGQRTIRAQDHQNPPLRGVLIPETNEGIRMLLDLTEEGDNGDVAEIRRMLAGNHELGVKVAELEQLIAGNAPGERKKKLQQRLEAYKLVRDEERGDLIKLLDAWIDRFTKAKTALQGDKGQSR